MYRQNDIVVYRQRDRQYCAQIDRYRDRQCCVQIGRVETDNILYRERLTMLYTERQAVLLDDREIDNAVSRRTDS